MDDPNGPNGPASPSDPASSSDKVWTRLAQPFDQASMEWRVLELSEDGQRARVRPQLLARAVTARLDEVLRPEGWSNLYVPFQEAVICTLTMRQVSKSAVSAAPRLGPAERADDALVRAAEGFGLRPSADQTATYWVDYNPEAGEALYEPEAPPASLPDDALPPASPPEPEKTEGQKAIDRLVERLRGEGKGAEVAKLVVAFSGYGGNPEQSRELYRRLRALLRPDAGA